MIGISLIEYVSCNVDAAKSGIGGVPPFNTDKGEPPDCSLLISAIVLFLNYLFDYKY
ncbi:hypothetical protein OAC50_00065 [bacterium]|jgi:hypothetical protein|nr:hypothetical protein [bacterium]|tara:strand:+ start:203 stop:373 length:171 start_codon:yes stop_codon:yes gene_type:complete